MSDNRGHGHVYPRADGAKARCGGPAICRVCAREQAELQARGEQAEGVLRHQYTDPNNVLAMLLEAMKGQLLIVLVNRLGGTVEIPASEIDATGQWMLNFTVDQERGVFTFKTSKKS